jgi:hypothetical protein
VLTSHHGFCSKSLRKFSVWKFFKYRVLISREPVRSKWVLYVINTSACSLIDMWLTPDYIIFDGIFVKHKSIKL